MENSQENINFASAFKKITFSKIFRGNPNIWIAILVLALISIFASISVSRLEKFVANNSDMRFWVLHACFIIISFFIIVFFQFFPLNIVKRYSKLMWLSALVIVFATMFFGEEVNGAKRALLGLRTFDIMKFAFPIYFARLLSDKISEINSSFKKTLKYIVVPSLLSFGIFIKDNISTGIIIAAIFFIMLIVSEVKLKYKFYIFLIIFSLGAAGVALKFLKQDKNDTTRVSTAVNRITNFISGETNQQTIVATASVQSAGLLPKGPGQSSHKNNLTQVEDDFIFSLLVEEWGLIGSIFLVIGCYLSLFIFSIRTIMKSKDKYSIYVVLGLILYITIQALIHFIVNIGGPVTGQTLPFISNGKMSIVVTAVSFGLIINVNSNSIKEKLKSEKEKEKKEKKIKSESNLHKEQDVEDEHDLNENKVKKILENLD